MIVSVNVHQNKDAGSRLSDDYRVGACTSTDAVSGAALASCQAGHYEPDSDVHRTVRDPNRCCVSPSTNCINCQHSKLYFSCGSFIVLLRADLMAVVSGGKCGLNGSAADRVCFLFRYQKTRRIYKNVGDRCDIGIRLFWSCMGRRQCTPASRQPGRGDIRRICDRRYVCSLTSFVFLLYSNIHCLRVSCVTTASCTLLHGGLASSRRHDSCLCGRYTIAAYKSSRSFVTGIQ